MNKFDIKLIFEVLKTGKVLKVLWYSRLFKKLEEDVLGFPLYFWQKQYIVGAPDSIVPRERACGKTTAHILRQILHLDGTGFFNGVIDSAFIETDSYLNIYPIKAKFYRRFYLDCFVKIYYLIEQAGIKHQKYNICRYYATYTTTTHIIRGKRR